MLRVGSQKVLDAADHRGEAGLHIGGASGDEPVLPNLGREGIDRPLLRGAGGHHVGVACKAEDGTLRAAARPEIVHVSKAHVLDPEAEGAKTRGDQLLAAVIHGRYRGLAHEFTGEIEYVHECQLNTI